MDNEYGGFRLKILQVSNFFKPSWETGGVTKVNYELSKNLLARGHDVTVYTTDGFDSRLNVPKNKPVDVDGVKVYYFYNLIHTLAKKMLITTPYHLPFTLRRDIQNFDIIHIHEHRTFLAVFVHYYAKKYGIPFVLQSHGSILPFFQKQGLKRVFDYIFGDRILNDASKVIALSETEAEQIKKMGVDEDKIAIVPNGINLIEYDNLPKKGEFRKQYSIPDNEKIVLFLGRIDPIKGLDLLIAAFSNLASEINNVRLVIAGPDNEYTLTLKKQVQELKIEDKVLFTGPLYDAEKIKAYVDADVYVLPSRYETFPNTVLEACACGTPVIITDRCGIADIVEKVGHVVEYDKEQLRYALFKMMSDDELRRRFGEEGRLLVREKFEWEKTAEQIENIYTDIIVNGD